jgi:acyl carrier protein
MVDRGARFLILLSRSGPKNKFAADLVSRLASKGARVETPACDVGDFEALKALLDNLHDMPPIKGCIQASMVLHDASFESMTFDTWQDAIKPKVQGTWNLHKLLPQGMDFYVMFSSVASVCGSKGQANYAAGNAFQDAVARHRVTQGEKAISLDLGPFFSMGIMTENLDLQKRWKDLVDAPVTEADLFALLDYYCNPSLQGTPLSCHTAVGLARGIRADSGGAYYLRKPMFLNLAQVGADGANDAKRKAQTERVDFATVFANSVSLAEASDAVKEALARKLATTLSVPPSDIEMGRPLSDYGVDSLVAVELRNWFSKEVHADIAIFDILGGATIANASAMAAAKSTYKKAEWTD